MKRQATWALAALAASFLAGCAVQRERPPITVVTTPERVWQVEHAYADSGDGRRIHYAAVGDPTRPAVVFVHGTPGSWRAFEGYLAQPALAARARLVSVDRLGFGLSEPGQAETSLQKQADSLVPLLRSLAGPGKPILVGHSYGGPVIAKIAMDHPELIGGLVMVAPSIDPGLEKLRWYNRVASWRLINWALPQEWLVSNREILPLKNELQGIETDWRKIACPVILIQGDADELVPPKNADFAERMLPGKVKVERIPAVGHFVLWQQPQLTVKAVLELLGG